MGSVFRRTRLYCFTCRMRPTESEREACEAAGHKLREKKSRFWYIHYKVGDRLVTEYTAFEYQIDAERKLRDLEAAIDKGARPGKITFDDAVQMVIDDYEIKEYRSLDLLKRRIEKHLKPVFGSLQMADLTTERIRAYAADRKRAGAKNGTIRAELAIVSRAFTLANRHGRLLVRPHIEKPPAADPREGFFTDEEFQKDRRGSPRVSPTDRRVPAGDRLAPPGGPRADLGPGRRARGAGGAAPYEKQATEEVSDHEGAFEGPRQAPEGRAGVPGPGDGRGRGPLAVALRLGPRPRGREGRSDRS